MAGEFLNAFERNSGGIVEVVNNYGGVTTVKQLKHSMASDVARAAGDQNILCHRTLTESNLNSDKLYKSS